MIVAIHVAFQINSAKTFLRGIHHGVLRPVVSVQCHNESTARCESVLGTQLDRLVPISQHG